MSNWLRARISTEIKNPRRDLFEKALDDMGYRPDYNEKVVHGAYSFESTEDVDCVLRDKDSGDLMTVGFSFHENKDREIVLSVSGDFFNMQFSGEQFMKKLGMYYNHEKSREWLEEDSIKAEWPKYYPEISFPITDGMVNKLHQRCPSALYNGQLKPLIGYAMRGVIWYQGEDNVPRYSYYAKLLKRMVDGWRSDWQQGEFPFYYCQIAPYDYSLIDWSGSQYLREQQLIAEKIISNSRMACLMDAGLEYGIHPRKKQEAGQRLALLALANTYQTKGLPDFATYANVEFQNDTAVVSFDRSKEWVYFENGKPTQGLYEIAGEDRVFHKAEAWISRNRLYMKSEKVKKPVAVRYAWKDWAQGDLMHDGLPVSSFRSDSW